MITAARSAMAIVLTATLLGACAETGPVEPPAPALPEATLVASVPGGGLLTCTKAAGWSDTVTIGSSGVSYEKDGVRIVVPPNAVPAPTRLDIVVPASTYVEVDVTANSLAHYEFLRPISITLSLERCRVPGTLVLASGAWHIDTATHALLEFMGGVVHTSGWAVTFSTDHLSGYAIAN